MGCTFYLVRHAHAVWRPDEQQPLSPQGEAAAEQVAELLAPYPITHIYASPYRRAQQTVQPLAERLALAIRIAPELRERQLAGGPVDDFQAAVYRTWQDFAFAHPGGESNAAAQQRGVTLVERLRARHSQGHVVLGTHGNLLTLVLNHYDPNVGYAFWQALTMPDVYRFQIAAAGTSLRRLTL